MDDDRFEIRITRYADDGAYDRVVEIVRAAFPERPAEELAAGLAVTPVLLSERATRAAAEALRDVLGAAGATVLLKPTQGDDSSSDSLEVLGEFLGPSARERAAPPSQDEGSVSSASLPPWERS